MFMVLQYRPRTRSRGRAREAEGEPPTYTDVDSTPRASRAKGATNKRIDTHAASVAAPGVSTPAAMYVLTDAGMMVTARVVKLPPRA